MLGTSILWGLKFKVWSFALPSGTMDKRNRGSSDYVLNVTDNVVDNAADNDV